MPPRRIPKPKPISGLSFRLEVTPLINGRPVEGVAPIVAEWDRKFATEWHEGHQDLGVRVLMRDMYERVRRARLGGSK